jgi:hypothetical protein
MDATMSVGKLVLMGVVGAGAGAFLALSTIPSFAPYRDATSRPYSDESDNGQAYAQAHASREEGQTETEQGLAVRLGPERGTLVLELPDWAGETVAWMGFGRRVWDDWRQVTDHFEDVPQRFLRDERRLANEEPSAGYAERDVEREDALSGPGNGRDRAPDWEPSYARPQSAAEDPAEVAARRAGEAAQDVLAAEGQ